MSLFEEKGTRDVLQEQIGSACLNELMEWLRTPPCYSVLRVNTTLISMKEALSKVTQHLEQLHAEKTPHLPSPTLLLHPQIPDAIVIKSSGSRRDLVHPVTDFEVVVGALCACSVLRGADVFAPGVMGMMHSATKGQLVAVYGDVEGKCLRGYTKHFQDGPKVFVGNGILLKGRDDLFRSGNDVPSGIAIEIVDPVFDMPSLGPLEESGEFMLQNIPSVACGHVLNPKIGDLVLDMCASPGGKSTHLATLVSNTGLVVALDKSENKIKAIERNAQRQKLTNIHPFVFDATKCLHSDVDRGECHIWSCGGPPFSAESFDHVLLDAPCSALGQRPQLRNAIKVKELMSFPKLQKKLFRSAVELVKPGGCIVYSTCTFNVEENEKIVLWAKQNFADHLELVPASPKLGSHGQTIEGLSPSECECVQRFFTKSNAVKESNCDEDTIGFFIAKFRKIKSAKQ